MSTDDIDLELKLERYEDLMDRRPLLLNSVLLRQNPHNVHEWHKRVKLFDGKPKEVRPQITQSVESILSIRMHFFFFFLQLLLLPLLLLLLLLLLLFCFAFFHNCF